MAGVVVEASPTVVEAGAAAGTGGYPLLILLTFKPRLKCSHI